MNHITFGGAPLVTLHRTKIRIKTYMSSLTQRLTCAVVTTYAAAMAIMALILHYGVEKQIDPPSSGIRVAFVIASLGGGLICGLAAAIFHRGAKNFIAPVAGFCERFPFSSEWKSTRVFHSDCLIFITRISNDTIKLLAWLYSHSTTMVSYSLLDHATSFT